MAIVAGAFGVALIAVLVSQNAQTGSVLKDFGTSLASIITAATSPVSGASSSSNLTVGGG